MTTDDVALRTGTALVVGAFVVLALGGLVTTWDGAWFVARLLETGTPTFLHGRLIGWLTQGPALAARWLGADVGTVTLLLGIGIAALPVGSLLAAWRICGPDRRPLLAFPVLGLALAALPGLAFVISEAFLAIALGWPIILAAALGRVGRHRVLVAILGAALAVTHPFAIPMLGAAALAAAVGPLRRARATGRGVGRSELGVVVVLAGAAGVLTLRYLLVPSAYEADTLSVARLGDHLRGGVAGRPLLAVLLTWSLGAWLLLRPDRDRRGILVIAGLVAALLVVLVPWALDVSRWERALMFRTWLLAAEVPVIAMGIIAAVRAQPARPAIHGLAIAGAGLVAIAVLTSQSLAWRTARDQLTGAVERYPAGCVELDALGLRPSALDHWGVTALVYLDEAPAPRHLVLADAACAAIDTGGGMPLKLIDGAVVERLARDGWFDLRELDAALPDAAP